MATRTLSEKIEALPPEEKVEVEVFVDALAARRSRPAGGPGLVERLRARRERLLIEHGLFDSLPVIRDLREHGPR